MDGLFTPLDHLPVLARLAGLARPGALDGINLSATACGAGASHTRDAALMMNYSSHWDHIHTEWPWLEWRAVRMRRPTDVKWCAGPEDQFDRDADPHQVEDFARHDTAAVARLRSRPRGLLAESHDEFRPGPAGARYGDEVRNVARTGRGPVCRL